LINIVSIIAASVIIFSLFGYSRLQEVVEKEVKEEKKQEEIEAEKKVEEKKNNNLN
jgi:hypothetical protein